MPKSKAKYTVIKDTREQDGWFFSPYDKCEGMEIQTLHTGDYTLKGHEDIVCVERKGSVSEIAMNLGRKKKQFHEEMERMKDFPFRYLILQFSASDLIDYPVSLLDENDRQLWTRYSLGEITLPKFKRFSVVKNTKITGKYLLKSLLEIGIQYETQILFADNKSNAFVMCNSIFKRLTELFDRGSDDQERPTDGFDF
jgi:hypothetical protein